MRRACLLCLPLLLGIGLVFTACGADDSDSSSSAPWSPPGTGGSSPVQPGQGGSAGIANAAGNSGAAGQPSCEGLSESHPRVFYLSADDSNSMASPAIARRLIREGSGFVPPGIIRTYEFLNYYNVVADAPAPNDLGVSAQALSYPGERLELQLVVQSAPATGARRPMTITLVIDTSGSMSGHPLEMSRAAIRSMAANLVSGDIVSAVTWNTEQSKLLEGHLVEGPSDPAILKVASSLAASGSTDLHSGLVTGYGLAQQFYGAERINRVVLISDGQANVGVVDQNLIGERASDENKEGIYLVGVGTGDGINDTLMNTVTDAGNGAYVFIDSEEEAASMFGPRFPEVMLVAARNVQVELTVPWYLQMARFYGEQYSTVPGKVKPQHLAPGDSMVFQQVLSACDGHLLDSGGSVQWKASWVEPGTFAARSVSGEATLGVLLSAETRNVKRGRAIVSYAETLRAVPDLSVGERRARFDDAKATLSSALEDLPADPGLGEISELLEAYRKMMAP